MNLENLYNIYNINVEPYIDIPNQNELISVSKDTKIILNQARRQREKFNFFLNAFDYISNTKMIGDYFEFGTHKARTFRMALTSSLFHNVEINNYRAFDSFEGMPDLNKEVINNWNHGNLMTSESDFIGLIENHVNFTDRIKLHKGLYNDSLNEELIQDFLKDSVKASLITIDCDLYESAVPALKFCENFLQHGTIIYLDDYYVGFTKNSNGGVKKAFEEFIDNSKYKFHEHINIGWWGKSFLVEE